VPPSGEKEGAQSQQLRHKVISLDGLLDYLEEDILERTFEASLAAEALWECLARDCAHTIAAALLWRSRGAAPAEQAAAAAPGEEEAAAAAAAAAAAGSKRRAEGEAEAEGGSGKRARGERAVPLPQQLRWDIATAFRFFDRCGTGFLLAGDLENILQNGGLQLSRLGVRTLVAAAAGSQHYARSDKVQWRQLLSRRGGGGSLGEGEA